MKKLLCGLATVLGLAVVVAGSANACIGADGKPVKGVNGVETNCLDGKDHFAVEANTLDFGRVTELDRSYTKQIVVVNDTDNDVIIDATVEKYTEANADSQELADWIAFVGGVSHFSVAKGEKHSLSVRAVVPSDATSGSQYALVKLTDANGYAAEVVVKLDIAGNDLKYGSEVAGAWIDPVHLDENLSASATVKNTGTAGFTAQYQIKTKSFFGGDWTVAQESSAEVLPGKEYNFKDNSKLGFGVFNVEQRVTFVNSEGRMVESLITRIVVNLPWWVLAIVGGAILLVIAIVIIRKKGSKKTSAPKELEKAPKVTEDVIEEIEAEPAEEEPEEKPVKPAPAPEKPAAKPVPAKKPAATPASAPKKPAAKPNPKRILIQ